MPGDSTPQRPQLRLVNNGTEPESRQAGSEIHRPEGGDLTMTRRKSLSGGERHMIAFCTGLVALLIAGVATYLAGAKDSAWLVSNGGTVLWTFGWVAYIAIWNSRSRWPGTSAWERLMRVLTFTR